MAGGGREGGAADAIFPSLRAMMVGEMCFLWLNLVFLLLEGEGGAEGDG